MEKVINRGGRIYAGVAGEYYVTAELSRRGAIATITSKNTPDFDVIGSNKDGSKIVTLQVKAGRADTGGFIVGSSEMPEYPSNSFYVFVLMKESNPPEYWVIPQNIVANIAETNYQNWIKGRPEKSKKAPRKFEWRYLKSDKFKEKYFNNWNQLGIF